MRRNDVFASYADFFNMLDMLAAMKLRFGFSDQHYELRANIDFVRRRLAA